MRQVGGGCCSLPRRLRRHKSTHRDEQMFNGAAAERQKKKAAEKGEAWRVMVHWVAGWQAAKKGLSHSPYVTCFPSASAVRICYQSAPAEPSPGLTVEPFSTSLFSCLCHMDVLRHGESMVTPTHTRIQNSHLLMYQQPCHAFTVTLSQSRSPQHSGGTLFCVRDRPWQ